MTKARITRNMLQEFRDDFTAMCRTLEDKYDICIKLGSIRFTPESFRCTLRSTIVDGNEDSNVEREDFKRHCGRYGLKPEDLGKRFQFQGSTYTLIGMKPRSPKYPFLGKGPRGGIYKFPNYIKDHIL